jgi:hypothetical protein
VGVKVDVGTVWCSLLCLSVAQTGDPAASSANAAKPSTTTATKPIKP